MSDYDTLEELEQHALSRRDLMVKGGLLAAGATLLGGPTAAAFGATQAAEIKIALRTEGLTWPTRVPSAQPWGLSRESS